MANCLIGKLKMHADGGGTLRLKQFEDVYRIAIIGYWSLEGSGMI
jgi:hypothetical protein